LPIFIVGLDLIREQPDRLNSVAAIDDERRRRVQGVELGGQCPEALAFVCP
jgi:hypothetical protein